MGADLFMALGDVLDRDPRPDHLVIEASGIADPAAIANAAIAEPEMSYAGIVTLVDAQNAEALLDDPLIAPQVAQQITAADLVLLSKADGLDPALASRLGALGARQPSLRRSCSASYPVPVAAAPRRTRPMSPGSTIAKRWSVVPRWARR